MKFIELNRKGNFDFWDPEKLEELRNLDLEYDSPQYSLYQDESIKLSIVVLDAYERMPFRAFRNSFHMVCLTGGNVLTRFSHGGISLVIFEQGERIYQNLEKNTMVNDLQNLGEELLVMCIVEQMVPITKEHGPVEVFAA